MLSKSIEKGNVVSRSKKLHSIESVILSDVHPGKQNSVSYCHTEMVKLVTVNFSRKWGALFLQQQINIQEALLSSEGSSFCLTPSALVSAFDAINGYPDWTITVFRLQQLNLYHVYFPVTCADSLNASAAQHLK